MRQAWAGASDAEYFREPRAALDRARGALGELLGWALDAPAVVPFDRASSLPMVLARRLSLAEDASVNWAREATLVASRLDDGAVYVGNAFAPLDLPRVRPAPVSLVDDGARVSGVEFLNLRGLLPELPWREGTLVVTALVGARRSNPVTVRLTRGAPRDAGVTALLDARRAVGFPRAVFPPRGGAGSAPFYRAGQHSPRVQGARGAALNVTADAKGVTLWGSARDVPRPRERVRADDPSDARYNALRGAEWVDVGAHGTTAVLPLTVIARHPELPQALAWTLQVPSYADARADGAADVFFGVEFSSLPGAPRVAGRWSFWAVSHEHIAGPAEAVVA